MLNSCLLGILLLTTVSGGPDESGDLEDPGTKTRAAGTEGQLARVTIDETDDSWSKLQISPEVITSMPYLNFRINIYKDSGKLQASQDRPKYYYAPLSVLDSQSAESRKNNVTNEIEMRFRVYLWSGKVEQEIAKYLSQFLKTEVSFEQVQIIPFERVILTSTYKSSNYQTIGDWIPYQFHQYVWFRLVCFTLETCDNLAEQMRFNSEQFSHLKLQFNLESQQSRRRETIIRVDNILSGALFSELNQRFPKSDEVLLTAADAKRLVSESATNVILETFSDEEIVDQQAQSTISSLLEKLMVAGREAISSDSSERWNSVFWNEDNYRPDKTTKTFNEVYRNSVEEAQEKLRNVISSSQKTSTEIGLEFEGFGFQNGFTRETSNSNEKEKEKFLKTITEAKDTVQWEGEKFSPKPMTLSRVNLSKIRNSQSLRDLTTKVKYTKAVLSTAINTPSDSIQSEVGGPWEGVKAQLEDMQNKIKNLQAAQGNQLASIQTEFSSLSQNMKPTVGAINALLKKMTSPVYFSAYRKSRFGRTRATLTYDGSWVNKGGALDIKTGIFTAPYRGIYLFSFNGYFDDDNAWNSVVLEVDGKPRAGAGHSSSQLQCIFMGPGSSAWASRYSPRAATTGLSQTLELTRGSRVGIFFGASNLYDSLDDNTFQGPYYGTQFSGMLLHNLE